MPEIAKDANFQCMHNISRKQAWDKHAAVALSLSWRVLPASIWFLNMVDQIKSMEITGLYGEPLNKEPDVGFVMDLIT